MNSGSFQTTGNRNRPSRTYSGNESSSSESRKGRHDTDTDSDNDDDLVIDTTYAGTIVAKSIEVAPVKPIKPNNSACQAISEETYSNGNKSRFPSSFPFQKTQNFLIHGPKVLSNESKTRRLRVRSGGKTKRRF